MILEDWHKIVGICRGKMLSCDNLSHTRMKIKNFIKTNGLRAWQKVPVQRRWPKISLVALRIRVSISKMKRNDHNLETIKIGCQFIKSLDFSVSFALQFVNWIEVICTALWLFTQITNSVKLTHARYIHIHSAFTNGSSSILHLPKIWLIYVNSSFSMGCASNRVWKCCPPLFYQTANVSSKQKILTNTWFARKKFHNVNILTIYIQFSSTQFFSSINLLICIQNSINVLLLLLFSYNSINK